MRPEFPLPDVAWPVVAPFWQGAADGRLRMPRCDSCGRLDWYPTTACRDCAGDGRTWTDLSGRGTLFSWTVVRYAWVPEFRPLLPLVAALVALDEDPRVRIATRIVDADPESLRPDLPVDVTFRELTFPPATGAVTAPFFRPR